jgi:3-oxoacyl-[acyl-carrier protein] reductase
MIAASSRAKQTNQTPALHRSIINVGSILGRTGGAGQSVYSSTKSALTGLSRSLAKELGPRGITVNVVSPGLIETDMTAKLSAEQKQAFVQRSCLRRPGTPAEVASSILFLTESPYITGQTLHVDGGIF